MSKKDRAVGIDELKKMSSDTGAMHRFQTSQQRPTLMQGAFLFKSFGDGLTVHATDATEIQDAKNSVELEPCLSFNIVFRGEIDFSLGGQRHRLGYSSNKAGSPMVVCSAITLSRAEIMTRHLVEGNEIRKLNVSLSHRWLKSRSRQAVEQTQLTRLFRNHGAIYHWRATQEQQRLAATMISFDNQDGLSQSLLFEQHAIQLAGLCIKSLLDLIPEHKAEQESTDIANTSTKQKLKTLIDQYINRDCSVAGIASANNMSVSTLQRRCKNTFNMTVNEYIRLRRLDRAKTAITVQGLSIGQAAYLAGYNHSSNFIAAFKKQYAVTPAELIKAHHG